jgi:hypothetical protein
MDRTIATTAVAALALVAAYGTASAQPSALYRTAAAVIAPQVATEAADQREVILPPSDIDPGMAKQPPTTGARMPIITPPALPGSRFGIER